MVKQKSKLVNFSPLLFLAALGAGGISVIPFAFFQYMHYAGKGLVTYAAIAHNTLSLSNLVLFRSLEAVMIIFATIHIIMLTKMTITFIRWMKTRAYSQVVNDPLKSSTLLAPFIAFTMLLNVFIGPIRYFISFFSDNFQSLMWPALGAWGIIWILLMRTEIKLLHSAFVQGYDIEKINFGWLLHPFALAMITVTGTGIAAMSTNALISHIAAFLSLISGSMGFFLLSVKMIVIFKKHFASKGMPDKEFVPSFLIVLPNITLFALSAFRFGHYLEHHHGLAVPAFSFIVIMFSFTFELWYLVFGLTLMADFFKTDFFKKEYYHSLWGLICPFVAFAVLGSFVYKIFAPWLIFKILVLVSTAVAVGLFFNLLRRHHLCKYGKKSFAC